MKTKHITIKQDQNLHDLLEKSNFVDINRAIDYILECMINEELIYDDSEFAGETLEYIFDEQDVGLTEFIVKHFHKCNKEIYNLFAGLVIWGADNECPDCGCELEHYEHVTKCTKCDYYVNFEPDPEQYRDDCEFQFDFSNQLN